MSLMQLIKSSDWQKHETEILSLSDDILASKFFKNSDRMKALMGYLIQENLKSPEAPLSPYQIAEDIFQRGSDFDPSIDPILRVQMARTRVALERYNTQNPSAAWQIQLPKGGYAIEIYRSNEPTQHPKPQESEPTTLQLAPFIVWMEPVILSNDPNGLNGQIITTQLVESINKCNFFALAGMRPWPMQEVKDVQLILSIKIDNTSNKGSNQLNITLLHPLNLRVLWQKTHLLRSEGSITEQIEKAINPILGGFWGEIMKTAHFHNLLPWMNKLYEFTMREEALMGTSTADEIHALFNHGIGINKWDIFQKLIYLHLLVQSWNLGFSHPNVSKQRAYEVISEACNIYPENLRLMLLKAEIANHLSIEEKPVEIKYPESLPFDLLELYAGLLVKNKQWDQYLELTNKPYMADGDISYFFVLKAFYHLVRKEEEKAREVYDRYHLEKPFFLNNLAFILCYPLETAHYQNRLKQVQALQFEFTNDLTRLLSSFFHPDDAKSISNLYKEKLAQLAVNS
ncbi:hypothetical protein DMA11_23540 [Marinilabiliaceae bacterium JC017]|nr:hypothetical protein DMA11_23540 [Marinilabiliaceae bacterium JC017]